VGFVAGRPHLEAERSVAEAQCAHLVQPIHRQLGDARLVTVRVSLSNRARARVRVRVRVRVGVRVRVRVRVRASIGSWERRAVC